MKKLLFLFVLNLGMLAGMEAGAQSLPSTPSAESMGLIRSIQTPVDLSTGVPQIQVPLYNVESFGIQVPVSLNYHASGLRVEDRPGIVGMGWRLSAGGKITRIVKGYPDGSRERMWGKTPDQLGPLLFDNLPVEQWKDEPLRNVYANYDGVDTEPDLFYFEIPGRSGMFVFDAQGVAHTIPYQNIEITWHDRGGRAQEGHFLIKDEQGTVYTFGNADSSRESTSSTYTNGNYQRQYEDDGGIFGKDRWEFISELPETVEYTSTWHLNSIESATGNSVAFSYVAGDTEERTSKIAYYQQDQNLNHKEYERTSQTTTNTFFLSSIVWDAGELRFQKSKPFTTAAQLLYSIAFYPKGRTTPQKTTRFSYEEEIYGRTYLNEIKDVFSDNTQQSVALFSYYDYLLSLPDYDSRDYDSWGYFNQKTLLANEYYDRDFSHFPYTDYGVPLSERANRDPNLEATRSQTLQSIRYPTGGSVEYIYELNKNTSGADIGGLRIKEIKQKDRGRTVSTIKYEYANPTIYDEPIYWMFGDWSGIIRDYTAASKPLWSLYDVNGSHVGYQKVKEIFPDGSRKEYWYDLDSSGKLTDCNDVIAESWSWQNNISSPFRTVESGGWGGIKLPPTSRFWRRNLLTRVQFFDSGNASNPVTRTDYEYELSADNDFVVNGFIPYNTHNVWGQRFLGQYRWESQPVYLKKTTETSRFAPMVITEYTYNTEHMVPTSVKVTDYEDDYIETSMKYPFHYTIPGSSTAELGVAIRNMQTNRMNPVIETVTKRNGKVVAAELHGYRTVRLTSTRSAVLPLRDYVLPLQTPLSSFAGSVASSGITVDSRYKPVAEYVTYDSRGLLAESNDQWGRTDRYHYNQYGQAVARVSNATSGGSFYTGFEADDNNDNYNYNGSALAKAKTGRNVKSGTCSLNLSALSSGTYELSYWKSTDAGSTWQKITQTFNRATSSSVTIGTSGAYIDEVRVHAKDARMTTSAYAPGIGKISESDALGTTTYYEYNSRGQLWRIYDNDRNLREEFTYTTQR